MLNYIFHHIRQLFLKYIIDAKLNPYSLSILALVNFYIFSTIYAVFVYVQFSILEVFYVSIIFLIIFFFLIIIFCPISFKGNLKLNYPNIFWSVIIFIFLSLVLHSYQDIWEVYYRTFPTLEVDNSLGFHIDSAFHISIINSIKLFGIPSTGLNDVPLIGYHVLSHYVDAFILKVTGLDAWETYGLFYYFKCLLLLSSLIIFIAVVCKNFKFLFLFSIFLLIPIVVSKWYAVSSHPLWFVSLIIILSAPKVYKIINNNEHIQIKDFLILFIILILITFGKVSSGFMYGCFLGIIIFFKNFKNPITYFFIFLLFLFFIFIYLYFPYPFQISINNLEKNLNNVLWLNKFVIQNNYFFLVFTLVFFLFKSKEVILFIVSICLSYLIIYLINILIEIDTASNYYFFYGLWSTSIYFVYQIIIKILISNNNINGVIRLSILGTQYRQPLDWNLKINKTILVGLLIFILPQIETTKFNFFNSNIKTINEIIFDFATKPFKNLNKIDPSLRVNIKRSVLNRGYINFDKYPKYFANINNNLKIFMMLKNLSAKNSLLFIPKEAFYKYGTTDPNWSIGQLIYAITGVPLVHGLKEREESDKWAGTYGRKTYDDSAFWVKKKDFDSNSVCLKYKKNIIVLNNLDKPDFYFIDCKKINEVNNKINFKLESSL
jgi:hypothetical protein